MPPGIAFTDLDGTLLAEEDYDWRPAAPALEALRVRGVPLIIASSKTRREIELWRARLGNADPYIVENGGALVIPAGWLPEPPPDARPHAGAWVIEFGTPCARLRAALPAVAAEAGLAARGFGDMAPGEVARLTGLQGEDLAAALAREYDEPFVLDGAPPAEADERLRAAAVRRGLRITRGGRFHHLLGDNHKGRAARALLRLVARGGRPPRALAAGDSANDFELLAAVDRPIVVARPGGGHAPALLARLTGACIARGAGPEGFLAECEPRQRARAGERGQA
jgi:mannosyl-3-phosphoglycerate phosphatase